ncbi:MAG: aminoacyl-tRNA hydrolase [bacterium]
MKLIVGLGNPTEKYAKTRHNVGWMVLDELAQKIANEENWGTSKKAKAMFLKTILNGAQIELLKPITYMNNSGQAVSYAVKNHNLEPVRDIIVVHDDKDIELGKIKIQAGRSSAGHNGVQSIMDHLKNSDFTRVRVGIARSPIICPLTKIKINGKINNTTKYVLSKFKMLEKNKLNKAIKMAVEEILKLI